MKLKKNWIAIPILLIIIAGIIFADQVTENPDYKIIMPPTGTQYKRVMFNHDPAFSFPFDGSRITKYLMAFCEESIKSPGCGGQIWHPAYPINNGSLVGVKFGNDNYISIYNDGSEIVVKVGNSSASEYIQLRGTPDETELLAFDYAVAAIITNFTNCNSENINITIVGSDHHNFNVEFQNE